MIPDLVKRACVFVVATRNLLNNADLQDLVRGTFQALGLHEVLRTILEALKAAFTAIAEGLRWLADRVVELNGAVAVAELAAPLLGGLGEALASLTVQLADLGAPLPTDRDVIGSLRTVQEVVDLGVIYVGIELPQRDLLLALSREVGEGLVEALLPYDPANQTNREVGL